MLFVLVAKNLKPSDLAAVVRPRKAVIKSAASAVSPKRFQAVIKSAAPPCLLKRIMEKLSFGSFYIGIPIGLPSANT